MDEIIRGCPKSFVKHGSIVTVEEESGSVWLWAFPRLACWPCDIIWLFSPVTGNKDWPGDVWGLDQAGELIILENKLSTGKKRSCDPMEDFVRYDGQGERRFASVDLRAHWNPLYEREREHILAGRPRFKAPMPGVLPYSSRRRSLYLWNELYGKIARWVVSEAYARSVTDRLSLRQSRGNPPPHYIGFVTVTHNDDPSLSSKGIEHLRMVRDRAGRDHVHLRAARAIVRKEGHALLHGWEWWGRKN